MKNQIRKTETKELVELSPDAICAAAEALRYLSENFSGYEEEGTTSAKLARLASTARDEFEKARQSLEKGKRWTAPSLMGALRSRELSEKGKAILSGEYWDRRDYFDALSPSGRSFRELDQSPILGGRGPFSSAGR